MEATTSTVVNKIKPPQGLKTSQNGMRNIVMELQGRQCGKKSFTDLKQSVLRNRLLEMSLSHHIDFERVYKSSLNSMDLEKDGRYLLSGGTDGSLFIHDLYNFSGQEVYQCKVVEGGVVVEISFCHESMSIETVQWYPFDSGMFMTSGIDRAVRLWDTNVMKHTQTFNFSGKVFQHDISPVAVGSSPLIAVATSSSEVKMIDLKTGNSNQELRGHDASLFCCRWSPTDPYILATGSYDSTIRLWDARSTKACFAILDKDNKPQEEYRRKPNLFRSHTGSVNGLKFTPNGRRLVSLGCDYRMRCWDMHNWKNLKIPFGKIKNRLGKAIEFSTCGFNNRDYCFVPDEFTIAIFELDTGKKIKTLYGHYNQVNTCTYDKDRMVLISGGQDRNILVWTADSQDEESNRLRSRKIANRFDTWENETD